MAHVFNRAPFVRARDPRRAPASSPASRRPSIVMDRVSRVVRDASRARDVAMIRARFIVGTSNLDALSTSSSRDVGVDRWMPTTQRRESRASTSRWPPTTTMTTRGGHDFITFRGFAASGRRGTTTRESGAFERRARAPSPVSFARGFAAEPAKEEDRSDAVADPDRDAVKVDLAALDDARREITKLHRERQLKSWERMYSSAKSGVTYAASFGPWIVSFGKMSREEWRVAARRGWGHVKEEAHHYWSGAKLLWVEVKIASRLSLKLMSGSELSRRERKQLTRTTADVFRLVPFAAFVLIPFMEVFLPVALKVFPNMLPTTFRNDLKHEEELKKKLKAKLEVARFLQDTVRMMAKGLKHSRSGVTRDRADDLYVFMKKIRSGAKVTNEDILKFSKLFNDEFTLYQVERAQLVNMCKFVGIAPYGTDTFLRFQLRTKLREIKNDDKLIYFEGLNNMTTSELRSAARSRGMRWESEREDLIAQLEDWLELSLKNKLPSTLLLLSRAFVITAETRPEDAKTKVFQDITDTLASLPEDVVVSAAVDEGLATHTATNKEDYTKRMEFLKREEEIIAEEAKETEAAEKETAAAKASAEIVESVDETRATTPVADVADVASAAPAAPASAAPSSAEVDDVVCEEEKASLQREKRAKRAARLSRLLTMVSDTSSVSVERAELMLLVKKGVDAYVDRIEAARCASDEIAADQGAIDHLTAEVDAEAQLSHELADQVSARVDKMLQDASKDIEEVEKRIGDKLRVLDPDCDGRITMKDLIRVRDVLGADTIDENDEIELVNILSGLIKSDGTVAVEDLRKLTSDGIVAEHSEHEDASDRDDTVVAATDDVAATDAQESTDASRSSTETTT